MFCLESLPRWQAVAPRHQFFPQKLCLLRTTGGRSWTIGLSELWVLQDVLVSWVSQAPLYRQGCGGNSFSTFIVQFYFVWDLFLISVCVWGCMRMSRGALGGQKRELELQAPWAAWCGCWVLELGGEATGATEPFLWLCISYFVNVINIFYPFIINVKVFYLLIKTFANKFEFLKVIGYLKFVVKRVFFFNLDTLFCVYIFFDILLFSGFVSSLLI